MESIIKIEQLKVSACHGVLDFEKTNPQYFVFNINVYTDFLDAAECDDLNKSISYCDIMDDVISFTKNNTFNLIETLAYRVSLFLLNKYTSIKRIDLQCFKPNAPYDADFKNVSTFVSLEWKQAYLSLGSNLGDKKAYLRAGIDGLNCDSIKVIKESSILLNEPYGGVADQEFANMAVEIKTILSPIQLLNKIHEIEYANKRERLVHWGNRTLDIDIILYEGCKMNTEVLTIPHKDYLNRDFVLIPLKEIAPHLF